MPFTVATATSFLRGGLFRNIVSLYGVQASHQMLQLLTIPFLARMLGPNEWGKLAEAQSVCWFIQLIVNYGFGFGATREVARHRDDPERIAAIVADTLGAQMILAALTSAGVMLFTSIWMPQLFGDPLMLSATILGGESSLG